ncbi:MAG: GUN4 domain-containing protein [Nostochopsis sp.]
MLTKQQRQLITYQKITIHELTYRLPVLKNSGVKKLQKEINQRQRFIKEGVRYRNIFGGIIKQKEEISQGNFLEEIQLFIRDYTCIIYFLENYKDSYQVFLLQLTDDLKKLFKQKYLELKTLEDERAKLEFKNNNNPQIIEKLKWEKQENLKAVLLLSNAYLLMIEKIQFLSKVIQDIAKDTKTQKQIVQQIIKELEVYQEIYEYQAKAYKIHQEIANIANIAINFKNSLQDHFTPLQTFIDAIVKIDEDFYTTVGDIKSLADKVLKYQSNLLSLDENKLISENCLDFLVTSYDKKTKLKDALMQSQLLDWEIHNFDFTENGAFLDNGIDLISNYISKQLTDQRKVIEIAEVNCISITPLSLSDETQVLGLSNDITLANEFQSTKNIDYTKLRNLLAQQEWKEADLETAKVMLQIMGKNYWNEVYKEDIYNFSCQDIHIIDQLWDHYSYGYFGFSVQQNIWSEMGGRVDYETEKRLGDRLGWRKDGNWLDYEQLTFKLSPMTPMGHLPAKWVHYDQQTFNLSPDSAVENLSMGAWRVGSWLVWQMHLFFSRVKICQ